MGTVLLVNASPKGKRSASARIAAAFLDAYRERHPEDTIREIALFHYDLPEFGSLEVEAKFAPIFGEPVTTDHREAWTRIEREIEIFKSADKILLASPMWNLGIPYKLKHYIDILVQPTLTFGYDRERMMHIGLVRNKPLQLILTRSSVLPGDFSDFQLPYLKYIFEFIGIHDIRVLTAWQTTKPSHDEREAYIESFFPMARDAARLF
jgi:FMN-dependent NADH-azoreductase